MGRNIYTSGNGSLGNISNRWSSLYLGGEGINVLSGGLNNVLSGLNLLQPTPQKTASNNNIYVAIRQDGLDGDGSFYNPFDGSTAQKMDNIFRPRYLHYWTGGGAPYVGTHYYFNSGVFPVWGNGDMARETTSGTYGFAFNEADSVFGLGKDITIFNLEKNLNGPAPAYDRIAFTIIGNNAEYMRMEDFTIHLNPDTIEITGKNIYDLSAIVGRVSGNITIKNVKMVGVNSVILDGAAGIFLTPIAIPARSILIENCDIIDTRANGGLTAGVSLLSNNHHVYPNYIYEQPFEGSNQFGRGTVFSATVRNCYVECNLAETTTPVVAYGGSNFYNYNVKDNVAVNCHLGFFTDTTYHANNIIRDNIFVNCGGIQMGGGYTGQHITTTIVNNIISIRNNAPALYFNGEIYDTLISSNIFKRHTTPAEFDQIYINPDTGLCQMTAKTAPGALYYIRKPNFWLKDNLIETGWLYNFSNTGFFFYTGNY